MGFWSYYFFAKFLLFLGKYIDFHFWPNLGFATFLVLPLRPRALKIARHVFSVPAGLALLYYDSWLPPFKRVIAQAGQLQQFDGAYLIELLGRFINVWVIASLVATLVILSLADRKLRLSTFVFIGILAIGLAGSLPKTNINTVAASASASTGAISDSSVLTPEALNTKLQNFYQTESSRKTRLTRDAAAGEPFDIVFLHICSLASDDLAQTNEQNHPLMSRFDIVFKQFNSAATYSGPAAIRLLRGNCGQPRHEDLYKPIAADCSVLNTLEQVGFQPEWMMNHDGHFGDFAADVHERGGINVAMTENKEARVIMRSFDDSPIYDDGELLSKWVDKRAHSDIPQVALYYNSISLHDGNHVPGAKRLSTNEDYRQRLDWLLNDINGFIQKLSSSSRRTVVVFIPEHGAALRGDRMQISGLREIPTPAITLVPVAIKLVGFSEPASTPILIEQPSSYLAMTTLLAGFVAQNPYAASHPPLADYVKELPTVAFVAENEGMVMMQQNGHDMLRNPDLSWSEYVAGGR